jgi:dsDNA-specific endonuclease/ATPase MutS2
VFNYFDWVWLRAEMGKHLKENQFTQERTMIYALEDFLHWDIKWNLSIRKYNEIKSKSKFMIMAGLT